MSQRSEKKERRTQKEGAVLCAKSDPTKKTLKGKFRHASSVRGLDYDHWEVKVLGSEPRSLVGGTVNPAIYLNTRWIQWGSVTILVVLYIFMCEH